MDAKDTTLPTPPAVLAQAAAKPAMPAARPSWWALVNGDVHCVLDRDPAARSLLEAWTIYPGVHAIALHRLAHVLWARGWRYLPRWISFVTRWLTLVDIHPGAQIGERFFIDHGTGIVIGETAVLGDDVTLYHGVTLGGTTWRAGKRHPTLGNQVVVGAGAKILGPISVGDRVRVAANSVVIDAVQSDTTVVGIPGRVVAPSRRSTHGFDLDHHLIPDPVGKAIACLLDRVAQLELAFAQVAPASSPSFASVFTPVATADAPCGTCDDHCTESGFKQPRLSTSPLESS